MTACITAFAKRSEAMAFFDGALDKLEERIEALDADRALVDKRQATAAAIDAFKVDLVGKSPPRTSISKADVDRAVAAAVAKANATRMAIETETVVAKAVSTVPAPVTRADPEDVVLTAEQAFLKALESNPALYDRLRTAETLCEQLTDHLSKTGPAPALALAVEDLRKNDPKLTAEQALLKALEADPSLYEG